VSCSKAFSVGILRRIQVGVLGEEEDAAGVGEFGVGGCLRGFGLLECMPGGVEVLRIAVWLFEVEVGEGDLYFCMAGMAGRCEGEGLLVGVEGAGEIAMASVEMSGVDEGGDPDVFIACGEGLLVAVDGQIGAAVGDEFHAEVEPCGGEAGAQREGAAIGVDSLQMLTEMAVCEGGGEVKFGDGGSEEGCGLKAGEGGGEVFCDGVGVGGQVESAGGCERMGHGEMGGFGHADGLRVERGGGMLAGASGIAKA
jgi:hypothetical protein